MKYGDLDENQDAEFVLSHGSPLREGELNHWIGNCPCPMCPCLGCFAIHSEMVRPLKLKLGKVWVNDRLLDSYGGFLK